MLKDTSDQETHVCTKTYSNCAKTDILFKTYSDFCTEKTSLDNMKSSIYYFSIRQVRKKTIPASGWCSVNVRKPLTVLQWSRFNSHCVLVRKVHKVASPIPCWFLALHVLLGLLQAQSHCTASISNIV